MQVDDNDAGRGWFIDQTPGDNAEFRQFVSLPELNATEGGPADHYDLLILVMHELGHVLGLEDFDADLRDGDVRTGEIGVGTRRCMPIFGAADPGCPCRVVRLSKPIAAGASPIANGRTGSHCPAG